MNNKKQGNNWTAYYDPETKRYFAEIIYTSREGREQYDYEITQGGRPIVTIRKEWMTWGDTYELDIANPDDEIIALAVVLTIDAVMASNSGVSVSISSD